MVGDAVVGNSSVEKGTTAREAEVDRYAWVWNRIRQLDPQAVLLRGPERLNPVQAAGQGDLDILVPTGMAEARAFLKKQGFERVYKPQAYLERYRFRSPELPEPSTIDLYKAERWGLGFRLARNGHVPADARLACLLHAVADGKGTAYFEKQQNGPPWQQDHEGSLAGPLARVLWRAGSSGILTLYLLLKGVIRPDLPMVFSNLCRRIAFRAWQLTRKTGLEVALLGVDGTGKSSLSSALLQLPAPVKAVYMGPHDYQTRIMRFALKHDLPLPVQQLAFRYDLFVRRLCGWLLARRGWIVVYDRHPAERLEPGKRSFRNAIKSVLDRFYAWPVDVTFWLTGDYRTIYLRKKEYPAAYLQVIDQRFQSVLERYRIPFDKIDVTQSDLVSVAQLIRDRVLAKYQERVSMDRLSGIFKTILE
ncbi:MAG: hypothetical protein DMG25_06310 [Acidobacteria bacterium]|nr:MAG: hypothetical protein DMG25_06310 [Acidobacteriota bacterium]PYV27962.1 MAG: hypothetical protein DMG27_02540 [Acidobacteriota bacterium]